MPVPVIAIITAKPESADVVREALSELVGPTREEPGCVSYSLYQSGTDPSVFITVESWRAAGDLDQHMKTDHIAATFAKAGDALAGAPVIHTLVPIDEA